MCLASNIPLEKVDKMTPWIKKINPQGGALSSADNLWTNYIPKVAEEVHGAVSVLGGEEEWTATDVEGFMKPVDTGLRSRRGEKF